MCVEGEFRVFVPCKHGKVPETHDASPAQIWSLLLIINFLA